MAKLCPLNTPMVPAAVDEDQSWQFPRPYDTDEPSVTVPDQNALEYVTGGTDPLRVSRETQLEAITLPEAFWTAAEDKMEYVNGKLLI